MKIDTRKEILLIIIVSGVISLAYNAMSDNGLPVIRKGIELNWESDSNIDSLINIEPVIKQDNILSESFEKTLDVEDNKIADKTAQSDIKVTTEHNATAKQTTLASKDIIDSSQSDTLQKEELISGDIDQNIAPTAITVEQAYRLYNAGAIFLDARMEAEYDFGHIKGAINLPYKKLGEHISKISSLPKNSTFITYCDGVGCDASIELANELAELGYTNIRIFYSGWNDWQDNNYPVESME